MEKEPGQRGPVRPGGRHAVLPPAAGLQRRAHLHHRHRHGATHAADRGTSNVTGVHRVQGLVGELGATCNLPQWEL